MDAISLVNNISSLVRKCNNEYADGQIPFVVFDKEKILQAAQEKKQDIHGMLKHVMNDNYEVIRSDSLIKIWNYLIYIGVDVINLGLKVDDIFINYQEGRYLQFG